MAIVVDSPMRPRQREQEREGILELLARGLASGAGQTLGSGLANLATQGLGQLMDPNMRPIDAQSLEMLGLDPNQAKSIASIRNPAVQRDIINATQQRMATQQEQEIKQRRAGQFANVLNKLSPQQMSQPGGMQSEQQAQQVMQPFTAEDVSDLDIKELQDIFKIQQKERQGAQKEHHAQKKEIRESWQATEKVRTKAREKAESAEEGEGILNAMEQLEKTGKIESGPYAGILSHYNFDYFLNPESQAFNKLRTTFMSGAKNIIGGRVTNQELEQFMKSVPSLSQSPEGRALIMENMRNKFELDKQYYQVIQDLENEYQGKEMPLNFDSIVHQRMKPFYKEFQNKFKTIESMAQKKEQKGYSYSALPDAAAAAGKTIQKEDGTFEWSDGKQWHKGKKPKQQQTVAPQPQQSIAKQYSFNADEY